MDNVEHIIGSWHVIIQIDGIWYCIPQLILRIHSISMPTAWKAEITDDRLVSGVKQAILSSPIMDYIKAFKIYNKTNPAGE